MSLCRGEAKASRHAEACATILFLFAAAAFGQAVNLDRVRADLRFLCSDSLAGRVSLSKEADISARYIAAEFERLGLKTTLQAFPVVGYRTDPAQRSLTIGSKQFGSKDLTGGFKRDVKIDGAPMAFVGYGITAPELHYDDYAGVDVSGKVVVMFDHEPQETDPKSVFNGTGHTLHAGRWRKVTNAKQHGAVAVLIASEPVRDHRGLMETTPSQGQPARASAPTQSLDDDSTIPAFTISDQVLKELLGNPADLQKKIDAGLKPQSSALPMKVSLRSGNAETSKGISYNAAGFLEGTELRDETILITAHYDHLGTQNGQVYGGANDNASGTVAVMELARMFAAARPKRSILFLVFGSEEQLMLGSYYYTQHPLRPLASTKAVINLDMIGRDESHIPQSQGVFEIPSDTSNLLNLVGTAYSASLLRAIERENDSVGLKLDTKHDREHTLNTLFRCDHLPFLYQGIPSIWFFGGFHPGYHEPSDTVDKLNFPKIEKVIRLAYRVAAATP